MVYVEDKIKEKFQNLDCKSMYFLVSFDNVISDKDSSDTWSAVTCNITKEKNSEFENLESKYISIESNSILNRNEKCNCIKNIWKEKISLLRKLKIDEEKINNIISCENHIKIRMGVKEFCKATYENDIPVIIISDGITEVIKGLLKYNDCDFDNIHVVSNNIFSGSKSKIIYPLNKNELSVPKDIKIKTKDRKNAILLTSSISDINMLSKTRSKTYLKIAFLENNINENFDIFLNYFDIICTHNTKLDRINDIIRDMCIENLQQNHI